MRQSLHDVVSFKEHSFDSKDRAKAEVCKAVLQNIDSLVFVSTLSGCADIYNIFGVLSNIFHQVNMLPFDRYDRVKRVTEKFLKLFTTIDYSKCPSGKCLCESYHTNLLWMRSSKIYMDIPIGLFEKLTKLVSLLNMT